MKYEEASTVSLPPGGTVSEGMVPFGSGARFGTVTEKLCSASRPPGSLAVTFTDALPGATPATVTVVSDMDAVATLESDDAAE